MIKLIIEANDKKEIEENKVNFDKIKKIFNGNIDINIHYNKKITKNKLTDLSGVISVGGDSIKETEALYV